jgi:hypothetical protein
VLFSLYEQTYSVNSTIIGILGRARSPVCGGLPHLRKYYFLDMVKTNIPFRFKENIINFYFKIAGLRDQISEKYWKTPIGLRARIMFSLNLNGIFVLTMSKK